MGSAIVFDLDETLVYSASADEYESRRALPVRYSDDDDGKGSAGLVGYVRPHARALLRYCARHFAHVVVYTAGTKAYADMIVPVLFAPPLAPPAAVLHRGHCVRERRNVAFRQHWSTYTKRLQARDVRRALDALGVDLDDTLFVDDLAQNAEHNLGQFVWMPKFSYCGSFERDRWLARLQRFIEWKRAQRPRRAWRALVAERATWFLRVDHTD